MYILLNLTIITSVLKILIHKYDFYFYSTQNKKVNFSITNFCNNKNYKLLKIIKLKAKFMHRKIKPKTNNKQLIIDYYSKNSNVGENQSYF